MTKEELQAICNILSKLRTDNVHFAVVESVTGRLTANMYRGGIHPVALYDEDQICRLVLIAIEKLKSWIKEAHIEIDRLKRDIKTAQTLLADPGLYAELALSGKGMVDLQELTAKTQDACEKANMATMKMGCLLDRLDDIDSRLENMEKRGQPDDVV